MIIIIVSSREHCVDVRGEIAGQLDGERNLAAVIVPRQFVPERLPRELLKCTTAGYIRRGNEEAKDSQALYEEELKYMKACRETS